MHPVPRRRTTGCPPTCPVYLPEAGRIPSRSGVLIEAATQLKNVGGIDIEEVLAELGPDPYCDGDHVQGANSFVISVPRPGDKGTKALRVHVSHDDKGRTRYAVIRVGVFWIGPDSLEYDRTAHGSGRRSDALRVQYGDAREGEDYHYSNGSRARPGAPTVNNITLAGDGTYRAGDITEDGKHGPWVGRPGRYSSTRVPEKSEQATRRIIYKLTQHWRKQPGLEELRAAHDRHHAPHRKADHDRRAERLRAQVEQLAAELAEQEEAAAAQAALLKQKQSEPGEGEA
ncbi:unnamed protein product [[Actinomadura] parvosata subsp. kistnae]|uniref:hypothetical protein n=1 Tax=[Actinomadura] parvosata TaxID=1955412 RepID=UPI000D28189E|nr:hypothetical protein [Nonomuraea sp. ATCC 55076]SPL98316.1 unnamed protein product [Actinomadura parvosata subsp. kistnae]